MAPDATRRAAPRAQLLTSEERFRLLVESVRDYAIFLLDPRGRVASWNVGAARIKGYRADEIIGQHFSRFYPPEDLEAGKPAMELREAAAHGRFEDEGWRVRKDGGRFWANVVITALRDEAGHLVGFAKVTRDLTERKAAEDALRQRTAELEALTRELDAFTYSVAHDLRAPLRALQGFSGALLEDYGDRLDETGRDYVRRLAEAATDLDRLVQDLLAFSRVSRADLRLEPVELATVLAQASAQAHGGLDTARDWLTVEGPLPRVLGHATTLVQVVANLLSNAVKFVAPGVGARVRVWAEPRDGRVRLWVEDEGIGIAPEHQARIFRVFERLHGAESYPGTGIGLAIVARGVERMGGRVGVESVEGRGSRFWIELPAA